MPRTIPTTNWTRDRYTFWIVDVNGAVLVDINLDAVQWITDTNPLTTSWT